MVEMNQIRDFVQPRYLLHFRKAQDASSHPVAPWITHAIGKQMRKCVSVWLVLVHFGPFAQCDSENQWEISDLGRFFDFGCVLSKSIFGIISTKHFENNFNLLFLYEQLVSYLNLNLG